MCEKVWRFEEKAVTLPTSTLKHIEMEMKRKGSGLEINREEVGLELAKWRIRQGLTQAQLAEKWGMSRYTILRAEKGKNVSWQFAYSIWAKLSQELRKEGGHE